MIQAALDHLWQSTLFALAIGLLVLILRRNSARLRYGLWFAASLKFLIPFALLAGLGRALSPLFASSASAPALIPLEPMVRPLAEAARPAFVAVTQPASVYSVTATPQPDWTLILFVLWSIGFLAVIARWALRWVHLRNVLRDSVDFPLSAPVDIKVAPSSLEPGLVGILRPVILLPEGIAERLSREELIAVITHELCHARRRDNLTAAVHMFVEAVFWFYPLVWWLGTMLNSERERACDETVLASGTEPEVYVDSIVKVCQFTVNAPLACASGVSGANLRDRIETIMKNQGILRLNGLKTTLLTSSAAAAIIIPLLAGVVESPAAFAKAHNGAAASDMSPALAGLLGTKDAFSATLPKLAAIASSKLATSSALSASPPAGPHRISARQACALHQPIRPFPIGSGTVIRLQTPERAEADIPSREARLGGVIDPSYLHDGRAVVRQDGGRIKTFDILPGMNVQVGDRVALQDSYRSTALPCAYVPILIIGDARPAQTLAPVTAPSDLLSLPTGVRTMVNQHDRHVLGQSLPVSITVLTPPAHGTVTTGTADVAVPTYAGIAHLMATQVFYQSDPGYTGLDGFTYRRTSPDPADPLNAQTYTISFQVK
jgi:beta-lactamase regulating signal transducer with metallopeptidase domain